MLYDSVRLLLAICEENHNLVYGCCVSRPHWSISGSAGEEVGLFATAKRTETAVVCRCVTSAVGRICARCTIWSRRCHSDGNGRRFISLLAISPVDSILQPKSVRRT